MLSYGLKTGPKSKKKPRKRVAATTFLAQSLHSEQCHIHVLMLFRYLHIEKAFATYILKGFMLKLLANHEDLRISDVTFSSGKLTQLQIQTSRARTANQFCASGLVILQLLFAKLKLGRKLPTRRACIILHVLVCIPRMRA